MHVPVCLLFFVFRGVMSATLSVFKKTFTGANVQHKEEGDVTKSNLTNNCRNLRLSRRLFVADRLGNCKYFNQTSVGIFFFPSSVWCSFFMNVWGRQIKSF